MQDSYATNNVLNRLLIIHHRSLSMYLRDAPPYMEDNGRATEAREVLGAIAKDHQRTVDELYEMLIDGNWAIHYGEYPLQFTAYHDLSLDFLLDRVIDQQRRDVDRIAASVAQLEHEAAARAAAERALGAAKAHLENLISLKKSRSSM